MPELKIAMRVSYSAPTKVIEPTAITILVNDAKKFVTSHTTLDEQTVSKHYIELEDLPEDEPSMLEILQMGGSNVTFLWSLEILINKSDSYKDQRTFSSVLNYKSSIEEQSQPVLI